MPSNVNEEVAIQNILINKNMLEYIHFVKQRILGNYLMDLLL